ncbi:HlyD family secretion protein [Oceaniglobus roseus]|uniref:HlyD family secretion protein n=1 Tax=Oceaniglobus roseus TaxID=1737570 RepID=UPI000C7F6648|nr:HlyD family secretion protein [Kandeliimicrobium roseum]
MADDDRNGDPSDDSDSGMSRRRKLGLLAFAAVLVVAGVAGGAWWYYRAENFASTEDAYVGADIVQVAPLVSGQVVALEAEPNSHVAAGDVLARLESSEAEAQLAQAKAARAAAEAEVAQARAGLQEAESAVKSQQSALDAARVKAEDAAALAKRYDELASRTGETTISEQQLLDARTSAQAAEAEATGAAQALDGAKAKVAAAEAALQAAEAGVQQAKAQVQLAEVTLSRFTVKAQIAGTVTQRSVNLGSFVSPGAQIMALVPDDLYVTANFKETDIAALEPGQDVDIHVDAFPDVDFHGTIDSLQPGAGQAFQLLPPQNASGNFVKVVQRVPVRIAWTDPKPEGYAIGPGMSVVVTVALSDN